MTDDEWKNWWCSKDAKVYQVLGEAEDAARKVDMPEDDRRVAAYLHGDVIPADVKQLHSILTIRNMWV